VSVFVERGKLKNPEKNHWNNETTNNKLLQDSNPGHIGGRQTSVLTKEKGAIL